MENNPLNQVSSVNIEYNNEHPFGKVHDQRTLLPVDGNNMKTPRQIVSENFKGLDDLIEDADLRQYYLDLIVICIEAYHDQFEQK